MHRIFPLYFCIFYLYFLDFYSFKMYNYLHILIVKHRGVYEHE